MTERTRILVGVDGSASSSAAVRYAVTEATGRRTPVHLVHVIPDYVPMAPMMPLLPGDMRDLGTRLLADAVRTATTAAPDVAVTSSIAVGNAASVLVDESAHAGLVVLGHETTRAWDRIFTGAVTMGVAARAASPIVSVPSEWTDAPERHGSIVVGFKTSDHDALLLEQAFEAADARGARLSVVHAWELPSCYDDIIVRRTHDQEWNLAALERIEAQVDVLRAEHPHVDVDVRVVHKQPAQALRDASREADLMLLARRGGGRVSLHLGGTARALLREAACPVEVLPAQGRTPAVRSPSTSAVSARAPHRAR